MGTNSFQGKNIIYQLFFLKEIINIVNENLNHVTLSMMKNENTCPMKICKSESPLYITHICMSQIPHTTFV